MVPSPKPTFSPTHKPTFAPTYESFEHSEISPTSSPTTQINIIPQSENELTTQYMTTMGVSIGVTSVVLIGIIYTINRCKKYNKVHADYSLDSSVTFTSIYDMEKEGWIKTVHPVHVEYDSDEESQIIAPIHENFKQKIIEPPV